MEDLQRKPGSVSGRAALQRGLPGRLKRALEAAYGGEPIRVRVYPDWEEVLEALELDDIPLEPLVLSEKQEEATIWVQLCSEGFVDPGFSLGRWFCTYRGQARRSSEIPWGLSSSGSNLGRRVVCCCRPQVWFPKLDRKSTPGFPLL